MSDFDLVLGRSSNSPCWRNELFTMRFFRCPTNVSQERFRLLKRACLLWFLTAVLLFFQAGLSCAASNVGALRQFSDTVHTFQARFTQRQTDDQGSPQKTQHGRVWLTRPTAKAPYAVGKFRWDYETPYKQLIVDDGRSLWVYDPGLKQATVRSTRHTLAGSPAALLLAHRALRKTFLIQPFPVGHGLVGVHLTPRSKASDFKSVDLVLHGEVPVRMVFRDRIGDVTDISFSHVRINRPISPRLFTFHPPKGTQIVHTGSAPSGGVR